MCAVYRWRGRFLGGESSDGEWGGVGRPSRQKKMLALYFVANHEYVTFHT